MPSAASGLVVGVAACRAVWRPEVVEAAVSKIRRGLLMCRVGEEARTVSVRETPSLARKRVQSCVARVCSGWVGRPVCSAA
jgi:hypothetical protein